MYKPVTLSHVNMNKLDFKGAFHHTVLMKHSKMVLFYLAAFVRGSKQKVIAQLNYHHIT